MKPTRAPALPRPRPHGTTDAPDPATARAAGALHAAGVRWCLLRDTRGDADDVDLLVAPGDLARAGTALARAGFLAVRAWGYAPHRFWFGYDAATGRWTKLDVVTGLAFGAYAEIDVPGADAVLGRAISSGGIPIPDPGDAFWTLLFHCLLDKGRIDERHARRLRESAPAASQSPLARLVDGAVDAVAVTAAAERADDGWLLAQAGALRNTLRRASPASVEARRLRRALARRAGWRLGSGPRKGLIVALLGPDGAGKSTLADGLRRMPFPTRAVYMGLYRRGGRRTPPGVGIAARLALQRLRWWSGRLQRARGGVAILDRHPYDALVPPAGETSALVRAHRRLLGRACPPPDLAIVLDAPAEILHARKGEHDPATLERQRAHYRALRTRWPGVVVIDTSADPTRALAEATAAVRDALLARNRSR